MDLRYINKGLKLEKVQIDLLKELQRNTSDRLTYQKLTTLLMLHHGYPAVEISELLGIDSSTVNRHYHQYLSSQDFNIYLGLHYKPCVGKLTESQKVFLKSYIKENLCHCADQVRLYIEQTFGVIYTVNSCENGSSSHLVKVEVWVVILKNGLCLPFAFRARLRTT